MDKNQILMESLDQYAQNANEQGKNIIYSIKALVESNKLTQESIVDLKNTIREIVHDLKKTTQKTEIVMICLSITQIILAFAQLTIMFF